MSAARRLPSRRPLRRRMAKAAFVLAAGIAPVVATADSAAADSNGTDEALNDTARIANGLMEEAGGEAVRTAMPVLMPPVGEAAHDTAHTTAHLLGGAQRQAGERDGLARTLPSLDNDLNGITL